MASAAGTPPDARAGRKGIRSRRGLLALVVAASAALLLAGAAGAAWPGKNGKIFFTTADTCCDRIWSMNADGSGIQPFWSEGSQFVRSMEISPNGQRLVFLSNGTVDNFVSVINVDGSGRLTIDGGCGFSIRCHVGTPSWSPDGTRILYTINTGPLDIDGNPVDPLRREVWIADPNGAFKRLLATNADADSARWSPDGTRVSYLDNGRPYWVAGDGSTPPGPASHQFAPSRGTTPLSPDGKLLVSSRCCTSTPDQSDEIDVSAADGSGATQVTFLTDDCAGFLGDCIPGLSYPFHPTQLQWQAIPAADVAPPTCTASLTAPGTLQLAVQDYGSGLAQISIKQARGLQVSVPGFDRAASDPVTVTAVLARGAVGGTVTLRLRDVAGNGADCTASLPVLGLADVAPAVDANPSGTAEAFAAQAGATGTLTSISVFVDRSSNANSLIAGIYADNGSGHPGTLLASGIVSPTRGSWNRVALQAPAPVQAGSRYWIAVLSPRGQGTLAFRDFCCGVVGTVSSETSAERSLSGLPVSWTRGVRYNADGPISAFGS